MQVMMMHAQLSLLLSVLFALGLSAEAYADASYRIQLQVHIRRHWKLPSESSGCRASVVFKLDKDGYLKEVLLCRPSGSNEFDESALQAIKASEPFPMPPPAYPDPVQIGFVFEHSVPLTASVEDYTKAILKEPKNHDTYRNRAIRYMQSREYDNAIVDLSIAIQLNPKDPVTYDLRAKAYRAIGRESSAVADEKQSGKLEFPEL
jgi:TonB family protein